MPSVADLPPAFFAIAAFIFGLLVGSFLNVVIYRVPRGESIIYPGSHCGSCGKAVKPYDNIPLLSYVLLRGRCRACKAKFSAIYPAVELLTGLLFLALTLEPMGITEVVIVKMAFVAVIISLIFIDARHKLLPDVITYPAFILAIATRPIILLRPGQVGNSIRFELGGVGIANYVDEALPPIYLWRVAFLGALLLALAVPLFWIMDRMDEVLFSKYFDWAETDERPSPPEETEAERKAQRQHDRVIYGTMILGVMLAISWIAVGYFWRDSELNGPYAYLRYQVSYNYLLNACFGALVGGGLIWLLRALYFYTRGAEGMGLGDVKMMAVIGAFLGWQQAIIVLIIGSLLGSIVGLVMARRSKQGLKTALPFGIYLGIGALFALFAGTPLLQWYVGMMR